MKIYLASSWRNSKQPSAVKYLREGGNEVYDFRNPAEGNTGFGWKAINEGWKSWTVPQFAEALRHPIAEEGFKVDKEALDWCEALVPLLPCGKSAHLEAGYAAGQRKPVFIVMDNGEPELMYKLATGGIFQTMKELPL